METSSFACVLIFLPAVVGLFPGPPPWSTCQCHHDGGDDVIMTMVATGNGEDGDDGGDGEDWHLVVSKESLDEAVP